MQTHITYYAEIKYDFWVMSQIADHFNKTPSLIFALIYVSPSTGYGAHLTNIPAPPFPFSVMVIMSTWYISYKQNIKTTNIY